MRKFCDTSGLAYWQLRDYLKEGRQEARQKRRERLQAQGRLVEQISLQHPTYGYRLVHHEMVQRGVEDLPGLQKVRVLMGELALQPKAHRKRRKAAKVTPRVMWPGGRRVQMDATQVELQSGQKRWVYSVKDVESRACLGLYPTTGLSGVTARQVLQGAVQRLVEYGVVKAGDALVIQTDGGSDFTSHEFQGYCQEVGAWIRSKVSQGGGMGILERMHRTFKYDYLFRHEVNNDQELREVCEGFMRWYNTERPHTALGYRTPASLLADSAA